jgi:flavodoxin
MTTYPGFPLKNHRAGSSRSKGNAMTYEVIFYSPGGNTKKVAEAMAGELGVTAASVGTTDSPAPDSVVFLGSGIYNQKPGRPLTAFIARNNWAGRKVAVFSTTSAFPERQVAKFGKLLTDRGANLQGVFGCRGEAHFFGITISRHHPDEKDLANARAFARRIARG